jgi:ribonuclease D
MRGLPRRDTTAILRVVSEARELPLDQCPALIEREQDPPQVALVSNVLSAVLGDLCARSHLAANLVANNQDVRVLVRARLLGGGLPEESLLIRGWRREQILPSLLAVLDGRSRLRVADVGREAPFELTPLDPEMNRPTASK